MPKLHNWTISRISEQPCDGQSMHNRPFPSSKVPRAQTPLGTATTGKLCFAAPAEFSLRPNDPGKSPGRNGVSGSGVPKRSLETRNLFRSRYEASKDELVSLMNVKIYGFVSFHLKSSTSTATIITDLSKIPSRQSVFGLQPPESGHDSGGF